MTTYICERHNCEQNQVLQDDKLVLYCPECAKLNIVKIIQLEEQINYDNTKIDHSKLKKRKRSLYSQFLLGLIVAFYLQVTPWLFAPLFIQIESLGGYFVAVSTAYMWMWSNGLLIMMSLILILIGAYNVKDAMTKIKKLPQEKILNSLTKKDVSFALDRFQASNRLVVAKSYLQKIHKKYSEQKTTVTPVEVMTEYELTLYYAKLLQHLKFTNVKLTVPLDSFGINLIGTRDGIKTAFMVVKDVDRLSSNAVNKLGTGRAYFDCEEAVVLAQKDLSKDMQQFIEELLMGFWNMEEIKEQITSSSVDEWMIYLEDYLIRNDTDLSKYAIHEKQRIIHLNHS
ncbi:hypothetical protein [Kurthia sibirica]|uniref:Uncharacterized protein n=1 Tax=Kurthia sibirica TaxID=202750 RepID=A0A2U3ALN2_9BACL|nr:hypothetical protein [Kurthia sibirica]PWI25445.1 hypothetical protein DEX24_07505 [Kurthia sibirica]GEK34976.1 hypothetical protein KSI01_25090 [Kurthia sibirica]